jgi:soluble lytic murein transglycosylase-like protein
MVTERKQEQADRRRYLLLVIVGVLAMGLAIWTRGPRVARQVWHLVGVHQVESHAETIRRAADEQRIDPCLLAAMMYVESRGDPQAISDKGALGLFQLMPSSAGDAARRLKLPAPTREALLSDPLLNARLAASHLRWLIKNDGPDLERVLVAYNAGRGRLQQWERDAGGWRAWRAAHRSDSDALAYAQQVLDFRERFQERGVIVPPRAPDPPSAAAPRAAKAG